ncbi:hypothetical protein C883_3287 [Bacillus stratosphericus LAMA 585]|nr:hypothetical protein C883_3287 [Bacillus stratosphericus LAMA 585]
MVRSSGMIHIQKKKAVYSAFSSVQINPRIRPLVCAPVLTNVTFAPLRCSPFLDFKGFHVTLKGRQRAKRKIILALCQQSDEGCLLSLLFMCILLFTHIGHWTKTKNTRAQF